VTPSSPLIYKHVGPVAAILAIETQGQNMTDITDDARFGPAVPDTPATAPSRDARLVGQYVTVVALEAQHARDM
jgi:hypothetical protein